MKEDKKMEKMENKKLENIEKITRIIELGEILYHYGNFAKLMEKTDVDVDNDFLEDNLLYVIIVNEIYKVIEEDIEDL
jgi:hypothetical protein